MVDKLFGDIQSRIMPEPVDDQWESMKPQGIGRNKAINENRMVIWKKTFTHIIHLVCREMISIRGSTICMTEVIHEVKLNPLTLGGRLNANISMFELSSYS